VPDRAERVESGTFELVDPPFLHRVQRNGVEVVQLLAAAPDGAHQVRRDEQVQVLRRRLAGHRQRTAQLAQRLPVPLVQPVEQEAPGGVGQGLEHGVQVIGHGVHHAGIILHVNPATVGSVFDGRRRSR
jgi:hypothetical protein